MWILVNRTLQSFHSCQIGGELCCKTTKTMGETPNRKGPPTPDNYDVFFFIKKNMFPSNTAVYTAFTNESIIKKYEFQFGYEIQLISMRRSVFTAKLSNPRRNYFGGFLAATQLYRMWQEQHFDWPHFRGKTTTPEGKIPGYSRNTNRIRYAVNSRATFDIGFSLCTYYILYCACVCSFVTTRYAASVAGDP